MVKVIHLADDGTEMAAIEVDDFTIEVIYSGIADMLREAAAPRRRPSPSARSATCRARRASAARRILQPHPRLSTAAGAAGRRAAGVTGDRKGRAATLRRHAHLPGGHPRLPTGPAPRPMAAPLDDLVEQAASAPPPRDFAGALRGDGLSCIAEIKRRSPSKGDLDPGPAARPGGQGLRRRRRRLPLGADRRRLLRRVARRPGRRPAGPRACPCCARTSPCRRPTWPTPA